MTPDEKLERRGDDIYTDVNIDVVDAVLGGETTINSVHGELVLKIPPGSQPESVLKLSSKGGPKFRGSGNGDMYVRLIVNIPKKITKEQREYWQKLNEVKDQRPGFIEGMFN